MISTSAPAQEPGSARSARGTPRNVTSGPYIPPSLGIREPPKISIEAPSMPRRAATSVRWEPVHQRAVGGVGEVEAGIRQVAQHFRGRLPNDDPADVHPARSGARGGEQGRVAVVA